MANTLAEAGAIVRPNGFAYFDHHLKHDYLASVYLIHHQDKWTNAVFDIVTFRAASFDIIAIALQQISDQPRADLFLRYIYDWNVYAPAYALAEVYHGGTVSVSESMQLMMLSMIADRRFDSVRATVERATDALSLFPKDSIARVFLEVPNRDALFDYIESLPAPSEEFKTWRTLFTMKSA